MDTIIVKSVHLYVVRHPLFPDENLSPHREPSLPIRKSCLDDLDGHGVSSQAIPEAANRMVHGPRGQPPMVPKTLFAPVLALAVACAEQAPVAPVQPTEADLPAEPPAKPSAASEPLRAVWATSGTNPFGAFDGSAGTQWTAEGDSAGEAVVAVFEQPASWSQVIVESCPDSSPMTIDIEVDARRVGTTEVRADAPGQVVPMGGGARGSEVRVRIVNAVARPCIADVRFERSGAAIPLATPRAVRGTVGASSTRKPFQEGYSPTLLVDGRPDTAWVEGAPTLGDGETVEFTVDAPTPVHAVEIWNGDSRSPDAFAARGAVRRLRLSVDNGAWTDLAYNATLGPQIANLQVPLRGRAFRLQIDEAVTTTPGNKDTAISEIRFRDGSGPWTVLPADADRRIRALRVELGEAPVASLLDRRFVPLCQSAQAPTTLKLRSNATFDVVTRIADSRLDDRVEGSWALDSERGPWSRIDLWQRTYRVIDAEKEALPDVPLAPMPFAARIEIARVADLEPQLLDELVATLPEAAQACWAVRFPAGAGAAAELGRLGAIFLRGPVHAGLWVRADADSTAAAEPEKQAEAPKASP